MEKLIYTVIVFAVICAVAIHSIMYNPEPIIIEKEIIIEKVVEVEKNVYNKCEVCEVCKEPQMCKIQSFTYQAITDKFSIDGEQELKKGDLFFLKGGGFNFGQNKFCKEPSSEFFEEYNCFEYDVILNDKLFKVIR